MYIVYIQPSAKDEKYPQMMPANSYGDNPDPIPKPRHGQRRRQPQDEASKTRTRNEDRTKLNVPSFIHCPWYVCVHPLSLTVWTSLKAAPSERVTQSRKQCDLGQPKTLPLTVELHWNSLHSKYQSTQILRAKLSWGHPENKLTPLLLLIQQGLPRGKPRVYMLGNGATYTCMDYDAGIYMMKTSNVASVILLGSFPSCNRKHKGMLRSMCCCKLLDDHLGQYHKLDQKF